jgi:hypothetical protein
MLKAPLAKVSIPNFSASTGSFMKMPKLSAPKAFNTDNDIKAAFGRMSKLSAIKSPKAVEFNDKANMSKFLGGKTKSMANAQSMIKMGNIKKKILKNSLMKFKIKKK